MLTVNGAITDLAPRLSATLGGAPEDLAVRTEIGHVRQEAPRTPPRCEYYMSGISVTAQP